MVWTHSLKTGIVAFIDTKVLDKISKISGKVQFVFTMKVQMGTPNPMYCDINLESPLAYIAGITLFPNLCPWFRIRN